MTHAVHAATAAVESLSVAAQRVAQEYGDTLGVRRLLSDVTRLRDDLAELGPPQPGRGTIPTEVVVVDDQPYDESMWQDAESESQRVL